MPEASIQATPMNNLGAADRHRRLSRRRRRGPAPGRRLMSARRHAACVSRLRSATPLQVMLKVRIAEVNRSVLKQIGVNLLNRDSGTGSSSSASARATRTINVAKGRPIRSPASRRDRHRRYVQQHRRRHHARPVRPISRHSTCSARSTSLQNGRPGHHARRAEPDRAVGRNRKLPRRRRVPDPGLARR